MSPSESFGLLSKMTFDLARQRSEVDRLWAAWQTSFFASLRAERKSPRLLVIEKQDSSEYYLCDCERETLTPIPPGLVERMVVTVQIDKDSGGGGAGVDSGTEQSGNDDSVTETDDERLQKAACDPEESPSGGQDLQG